MIRYLLLTSFISISAEATFIKELDHAVFRSFNQPTEIRAYDTFCDIVMLFSTHLGNGFIATFLVGLLLFFFKKESFKHDLLTFIIILLLGGTLIQILKFIIDSPRPLKVLEDVRVILSPLRERGFPSGHTQTIFTAATFLYYKLRKYFLILFGIATLVGLSRIYVGAHFPSDVIGGAIIGIAVTYIFLICIKRS